MFAGLRPMSEVMRLRWEHLDFERGLIDIAADRTKTAQKRFVVMTDVLLSWLVPLRKLNGPIYPGSYKSYRYQLWIAWRKAGMARWPIDALRHTHGSMHFEHFKNAGETAAQMGHINTTMLFKHYRARVKPEEAAAFWNIRPARQNNIVPMVA